MEIISREQWGAKVPRSVLLPIPTPTPELWLHHTAGNHRGASGMRAIEDFHVNTRGWRAIAYSFVVDRIDLKVYEGRGAGIAGGHTRGHNRISHAICVMGNFEHLIPQPDLLDLLAELVAHGHNRGWWPAQFTGGHRDASGANTACPGRNLYARINDINQLALEEQPVPADDFVARIQEATIHAKYSPTDDLNKLADNVKEIAAGLMKQLADKELLQQQLSKSVAHAAELRSEIELLTEQLQQSQADQDLAAAVRALVKAEQNGQ